eukprot:189137_1
MITVTPLFLLRQINTLKIHSMFTIFLCCIITTFMELGLSQSHLSSLCVDCYNSMRNTYDINQFWWQGANEWTTIASMFDVLIKTGSAPQITNQFDAMPNFKMNCYNDDGLWWTLAYYKLYVLATEIKNTSMINKAETNFKNGLTSIMDANYKNSASKICSNQGILWCNADYACKKCNCGCPYKNAIANELFLDAISKARKTFLSFYNSTVIGKYGYNFDDIMNWFVTESKMIQSNYQIKDGLDHTTCNVTGGIYSYNQGVILGPLIESGKYNNILTAMLHESYNVYTKDNNDGFGRIWIGDSCKNKNPGDGTIFDAIFIRYLSDIMPQLSNIDHTLANQWKQVINNTVNKIQRNNQTGASYLYGCPLQYLHVNASTSLNINIKYNVWIQSQTSNQLFLAMNNNGKIYNYNGNAVDKNDKGNPGWILETNNNGESYCIYNPFINSQTSNKYAYLSCKTLGSNCSQNIWNGNADYGDVIDGSSGCLRDELVYIELIGSGVYSIRCAKCNLSPQISKDYHPMYVGMYNGGPGYNTGANSDEQFVLYSQDTKQKMSNIQTIIQNDIAMNQLTMYTNLQWFVAALKTLP